jgi:hypothetical protein
MSPETCVAIAATESRHWWFRGYRKNFDHIIGAVARLKNRNASQSSVRHENSGTAHQLDPLRHFSGERRMLTSFNLPAGVSLMGLARAR